MQLASIAVPRARRHKLTPAAALVLVGAVCAAAAGLLLLFAEQARLVREGTFFGFPEVAQVELFGRTLYRDAMPLSTFDVLNGFLLIALATTAFFVCVLLSTTRRWSSGFAFFLLVATGASFLAADEVLSIHETLGYNLRFLADLPGVRHPDDAILAFYAVPAALFATRFRARISSSRPALFLLAAGGVLFVAGSAMDLNAISGEERVEPLSTLALLCGFFILALQELRRSVLRTPDTTDSLS